MSVKIINPSTGLEMTPDGNGQLVDGSDAAYPIINGIPRVCDASNYTSNFGLQWNKFDRTQLDPAQDGPSAARFFATSGWTPEELDGATILEVGSGAGRFSRVVLQRTNATLFSVDYSSAVEANLKNNGRIAPDRLHLFQASIYEMPFPDRSFDKTFCLGVLQHTPDFERSVKVLIDKTRKGGQIVVDFYPIRGWWTKVHAKYLLRPLSKRVSHEKLLRVIDRNADWMIGLHRILDRFGLHALTRIIPIVDLRTLPAGLNEAQVREWAVLDTFDMFSPQYDNPQRLADVAAMFRRHGADVTFAEFINHGYARAAVIRATAL
jgi:SAM-dependent methyltransferase